jgi:predicted esterase
VSAPVPVLSRRALLSGIPAAAVTREQSATGFDVLELPVESTKILGRSLLVITPRRRAEPKSLPVVVLLHGLGETHDQRAGLFAWLGPYGLGRAWERLEHPPLAREREAFVTDTEYAELNRSLADEPFRGVIAVCPFMPNPYASQDSATRLELYSRALVEEVLPAVRARVPAAAPDAARTCIAGVSLGGAVALEVLVRRPGAFGALGTVQGAYGKHLAPVLARRVAEQGAPRAAYVATSSGDPYRAANVELAKQLEKLNIPAHRSLRTGPHSQGWLIEIGSLELLLWCDRALRDQTPTRKPGAT